MTRMNTNIVWESSHLWSSAWKVVKGTAHLFFIRFALRNNYHICLLQSPAAEMNSCRKTWEERIQLGASVLHCQCLSEYLSQLSKRSARHVFVFITHLQSRQTQVALTASWLPVREEWSTLVLARWSRSVMCGRKESCRCSGWWKEAAGWMPARFWQQLRSSFDFDLVWPVVNVDTNIDKCQTLINGNMGYFTWKEKIHKQ